MVKNENTFEEKQQKYSWNVSSIIFGVPGR
jgi:hypothetical protein